MKILFINLPYYGHIVPTIGLVQALIRRGCQVTYLIASGWESQIAESGAVFSGYPYHRQLSEQMKNAYAAADKLAAEFDYIVYEQFFFLGKHLAEKHRKPAARIFTAPATNPTLMQAILHEKGPMSIFRHKWIAKAFTRDIAKGIPLKTDNWIDEILFNPPPLNLVYTLRNWQPYAEDFPEEAYCFLGPSVYDRITSPLDFDRGKDPLIYISLGTLVKGSSRFFQSCMEAFRQEPVEVILSAGKQFNIRKLKDIPPNVHVYASVPQMQVLRSADVFITHGGMNSISEALVSGTPMVVIPFVSDQRINAQCVQKLGVGKWLERSALNKTVLKDCVLSLLENPEIQNNLARVQEWIRQAPGNSGGADRIIHHYEAWKQSASNL